VTTKDWVLSTEKWSHKRLNRINMQASWTMPRKLVL
jgi:hypothetical protein